MIINKKHLFLYLTFFCLLCKSASAENAALEKIKPSFDFKSTYDLSDIPEEVQKDFTEMFSKSSNIANPTPFLLDQMLIFLQKTDRFEQVEVNQEIHYYKFKTINANRITSINISGSHFVSDNEISSVLPFKTGSVLSSVDLEQATIKVKNLYKEHGFFTAKVDVSLINDIKFRDQNIFKIQISEGPRTIVKKIEISTPNKDLIRVLQGRLKFKINEPLTENLLNEIQQDSKEVLKRKFFYRTLLVGPEIFVNEKQTEAILRYNLENPFTFQVEYLGNEEFSRFQLDDQLEIYNYLTSSPSVSAELINKLRNIYLKNGFARVEIEVNESQGKHDYQRKISFKINEGPKVKISKIQFNGKYSKANDFYSQLLVKNSSDLIQKSLYNKEDIELGLKNMTTDLQNQGYLQAKIISVGTQYNKNKDQIQVLVNLDEGPLTEVNSIEFIGNEKIKSQMLMEQVQLSQKGALKLAEVELAVEKIKHFYWKQGYIEMSLQNEKADLISYQENSTKANITFKINEGPLVKVGSLLIDGNNVTDEKIIRIELELKEGDIVTPAKIEESISRLQRTGFFSSVEIKTLEERTQVSERTLIVKLTERDPGVFIAGAGGNNDRTLTVRGYLSIGYKNILGTGRSASFRVEGTNNIADLNYWENKFTAGYAEPYILNTRYRGKINWTKAKYVTDYDLKKVTELNQYSAAVEKDFTSQILGAWDILDVTKYNDFGIDETLNSRYSIENKILVIGATGPTLDIDFRDNPFNPTQGTLTKLSAEYSSPSFGSSDTIEYVKTQISFSHYLNLYKSQVIWANQVRGALLQNLNHSTNGGVPYDKKGFTLGGRSTLRGYSGSDEVFPNRAELGNVDSYNLTTKAKMYLIKSELRFPLFGIIGGTLFYDGGLVSIDSLNLDNPYKDTTGFGIRINTPIGPVNAEFGWKLRRQLKRLSPSGGTFEESPFAFHLSFGSF